MTSARGAGDARVETRAGALRGCVEHGVSVFRGVPYARPPVGELRLRPPQPAVPWRGERDATRPGAAPPQRPDPLVTALGLPGRGVWGEDCLGLDVWTPGLDARRRPVLVWLPGGAFANGDAAAPLYDGRRLAARGDAVVVSVGYRVGALGFLGLGAGESGANFGLQDQLAALRWVRDEIAGFGGDPGNVTVFGESAGAGSLLALLAMPRSRGLLRRAIVQSAAPEGVIDAAEAARRAELLLAKLGLATGDAEGLRAAPLEKILDAQQELAGQEVWDTGLLFAPVVEGELLPERPLRALCQGAARDVELLIGSTRDEMRLYVGAPFEPRDEDALAAVVAAQLPGDAHTRGARAAALVEAYRGARRARGERTSPPDLLWAILTDLYLRVPATRLAAGHARHQPETRMYLFTWASPARDGAFGSCHALDLPFTFGNLDAPGMAGFAGTGEAAQRLAANLMEAWLGFARRGDPAHAGIGAWPAYEAGQRITMELGARCGAREAPREAERAAWDEAWPERT
jgi:para-nitrobenzyl esterase